MFYLRVLDYAKWVPANWGSALRDIYKVHQNRDNCFFWSKCVYLPFKHQNILVFWSSCVKNFFHFKGESLSWPLVIDLWEPSILYLIHLSLSLFCYFVLFMCLFACFFFLLQFFCSTAVKKKQHGNKILLIIIILSGQYIIHTEHGLFKNWARQGKVRLCDFQ